MVPWPSWTKLLNYLLGKGRVFCQQKAESAIEKVIYPSAYTGNTEDDELKLLMHYLAYLKGKKGLRGIEKRNWKYNTIRRITGDEAE